MRRILTFVAVLALLLACALPAFAIGNQSGGTVKYSSCPFSYFYASDPEFAPNVQEWPFGAVVIGTNSVYTVRGYNPSNGVYTDSCTIMSAITNSSVDGGIDLVDSSSSTGYTFTLSAFNAKFNINRAESAKLKFTVEGGMSAHKFQSARVYGTFLIPYYNEDGNMTLTQVGFNKNISINGPTANIGNLLFEALRESSYYRNDMYFAELYIDLAIRPASEELRDGFIHLYWYEAVYQMYNYPTTVMEWLNSTDAIAGTLPSDRPVPEVPTGEFNIGAWLAESVGGFLDLEIFEGFRLSSLLYAILTVGIVFWFIKLCS